jgi:hypothetical protein
MGWNMAGIGECECRVIIRAMRRFIGCIAGGATSAIISLRSKGGITLYLHPSVLVVPLGPDVSVLGAVDLIGA